jgi:hypothetical protein
MKQNRFTQEQVLLAVKGSGGMVQTVSDILHCDWHTAKRQIGRWESTKLAFQDEMDGTDDLAESILVTNLKLLAKEQETTGKPVESLDAKWWLGKRRMKYADKIDVTTAGEALGAYPKDLDESKVEEYAKRTAEAILAIAEEYRARPGEDA